MEHDHHNLLSSESVLGSDIFGPDGERMGHIAELLIDKETGKVAYALMGFGGFLGMAEDEFPVPWAKLAYDRDRDGYVTSLTREQLKAAPQLPPDWRANREWERRYFSYYGLIPYWV